MSSFEDGVWNHLVQEHEPDLVEFSLPRSTRWSALRSGPGRLVALSAALGTSIAAAVVALTVFTGSTAAYAFTANDNGTATVSLNDLSTGIPALNQLFAEKGIRETVVPIEAGCTATDMEPQAYTDSAGLDQSVTVGNQWIPAGYNGFLAARQMPNGQILMAMGTMPGPIPACFPATPAPAPKAPISSSPTMGSSGTATPAGSSGTATP
jgi:hypothetical protein